MYQSWALSLTHADLGVIATTAALQQAKLDPALIDDCIFGAPPCTHPIDPPALKRRKGGASRGGALHLGVSHVGTSPRPFVPMRLPFRCLASPLSLRRLVTQPAVLPHPLLQPEPYALNPKP